MLRSRVQTNMLLNHVGECRRVVHSSMQIVRRKLKSVVQEEKQQTEMALNRKKLTKTDGNDVKRGETRQLYLLSVKLTGTVLIFGFPFQNGNIFNSS